MCINKQDLLSTTKQDEIPVIKITVDCECVSHKKVIARIQVVKPDGRLLRQGDFSRTRKDGYMFE